MSAAALHYIALHITDTFFQRDYVRLDALLMNDVGFEPATLQLQDTLPNHYATAALRVLHAPGWVDVGHGGSSSIASSVRLT